MTKRKKDLVKPAGSHPGETNEELRTAQARIETWRARYLDLYDLAPVGFCTVSEKGLILEVNLTAATLLGTARGALVKQEISRFILKDDQDIYDLYRKKLFEAGEPQECELRLVKPDGTLIWAHLTATAAQAEDGTPLCRVVLIDITERKRAEEAHRENEALLSRSQEIAHTGSWKLDLTTNRLTWADEVYRIFGCKPQEFAATYEAFLDFVHPEDRTAVDEVYSRSVREGNDSYEIEHRIVRRNSDEVRYVHERCVHERDASGAIIQSIGMVQDITERKRADEQLRKSEEKYRNIFENVQDVYYEASLDGLLLEISPSIEPISRGQYRQADLIGRQILDFYDDAEERDRLIIELLETSSVSDFEISLRNRDGSLVPCSISAKLLWDARGNPVKIIGTMRDITDRKRVEQEREKLRDQLIQAQKMEAVGRLAGGVAHDYNNMLSVILGYTEMALEQVDPAGSLHADLMEVYNAGKRSTEITRQLLAFARKQTISPKVLDLNDNVEKMLKMLRRLIGEDIDLEWHPEARLWPVKMDPTQVDQILANLCVNARDAIAEAGKVTIETKNTIFNAGYCENHVEFIPGQFVLLAVSDDGCGMDREILNNLFEPFFTTKDVGEGTGLGLATIYGIVKQNHGFVNVYSEPGKGTTFKVYLPRHAGEAEPAEAEIADEPARGMGETILLVEDEPKIIKMGKMMLENLGYRVLTAETQHLAVDLTREHAGKINLLMIDVIMPEMNGRDLAEKLQGLNPDLKILFMSGYTANVIAHHGVLDKGVHFIQKPFSRKELAEKVREALGSD